jgi:hypothetical protein
VAVYLLHSTVPLVLPSGREVRHYLGWTTEGGFVNRLRCHIANRHSARIVQAFLAARGELCLGMYWPNLTRHDESRMKKAGHLGDKCMICQAQALERRFVEMVESAGLSMPPPNEP